MRRSPPIPTRGRSRCSSPDRRRTARRRRGPRRRRRRRVHRTKPHGATAASIELLADESIDSRDCTQFPEPKTLDAFDFEQADGIERGQILELARCTWIDRAENLVLAGPIGTGKTHLAITLGIEAVRQRKRVAFYRAADLVRMMIEARDARELGRLQRRLDRVDVLVLDELGFVPFDRHGGELLFHVIADRYERHSVVVTTNLAFSEWPKVFGDDEKLTTALLDRLAHHATVITPRGKSYRMKKRARQSGPGDQPGDPADQAPAKSPRKR